MKTDIQQGSGSLRSSPQLENNNNSTTPIFTSSLTLSHDDSKELTKRYGCSLFVRKVPRPGWLVIYEDSIRFNSKMTLSKIATNFKEVANIKRYPSRLSAVLDTITITLGNDEDLVFTNFLKSEEVFNILKHYWEISMKKRLNSAQTNFESLSKSPEEAMLSFDELESSTKYLRLTGFHDLFRIPAQENLSKKHTCYLWKKSSSIKGLMYISDNFFCYSSWQKDEEIQCVFPIVDIAEVQTTEGGFRFVLDHTVPDTNKKRAILFNVSDPNFIKEVFSYWQRKHEEKNLIQFDELEFQSKDSVEPSTSYPPSSCSLTSQIFRNGVPTSMAQDTSIFSENYLTNQASMEEKWKEYFVVYGYPGICMLRSGSELRALIRGGVPDNIRGLLWNTFSGAAYHAIINPGLFEQMLENPHPKENVLDEIEKDLHRSYPEHPMFHTEEGINSLRRVLVCYSQKNPEVGYCQAMNIISSLLLTFMGEIETFWTLTTICEEILPEYYHRSLLGSIVDDRVFQELVESFLPNLSSHLKQLDVPLALASQPWFLCLFIGYVPLEASLRILDWFFYEGRNTLFSVGLALLKLRETQILEEKNAAQILMILKERSLDISKLMPVAYELWDQVPKGKIDEMRNYQRHNAIIKLENTNRKKSLATVQHQTKFPFGELENLHDTFQSVASSESPTFIEYEQFIQTLPKLIPEWQGISGLSDILFQTFDRNRRGRLEFSDFVLGLEPIKKGTSEEKFQFCFKLYSDKENRISRVKLINIIYCFLRLYDIIEEENELTTLDQIQSFVRVTFEKLGSTSLEDTYSYEKIAQQIIEKPILLEFFGIEDPDKRSK